jgi:hypothetical protein
MELFRRMRIGLILFSLALGAPALLPAQTAQENHRTPESWNRLLPASQMQFSAAAPLSAGVQTGDGFTRELLRAEWRGRDPIDLYIVRPANAVKPPVILFLYSWPEGTGRFRSDAWCRTVTQHGFAAVGMVSALTGQRYHDRPWKESFLTELPEALGKSVHDVQLLLDYLDTRSDLDMTRAGIFGQGSGGTIAILAASIEPRLKAVDVIDPWGDWPDWYAASPLVPASLSTEAASASFAQKVAPFDPVNVLARLDTRPLRMQETSLNPSTPPKAREKMRQALPRNAIYVSYPTEADYRQKAMADGKILDWMQGALHVNPEVGSAR